jgi:hypothetical protein
MNKLVKGIFFAGAVILLLSACRSSRPMIKEPMKEEGPDYLYSKLKQSEFEFDWLSMKFSAGYSDKKSSADLNGQIRIRKDSMIWITATPALGLEMFRMVITTDSVKYLNRMSKEYFAGDYALVNRFLQIDVDFDMLQSIITGNDFQFYETNTFRASIDNLNYKLSTTGRRKIRKEAEDYNNDPVVLLQNIWLDPSSYKIKKIDLKEYMKDNRKLTATYGDFQALNDQIYPTEIRFEITAEETFKVKINYEKVTVGEPMTFPFSIPENYQMIR